MDYNVRRDKERERESRFSLKFCIVRRDWKEIRVCRWMEREEEFAQKSSNMQREREMGLMVTAKSLEVTAKFLKS